MRPVNHQVPAFIRSGMGHGWPRAGWQVMDHYRPNFPVRSRRDALDGNPVINDRRVIHNRVVVNDGRAVVNPGHLGGRQAATTEVMLTEIANPNEGEAVRVQAEIEIKAYVDTVESPTNPHHKLGTRR